MSVQALDTEVVAVQAPSPNPVSQAPDLDDAKRSFLRMVSHELRTPLNSVIGFSEVIRESGQKLLRLVNQVLEIARLDAGAADLRLEPESAALAVKRVTQMLADEADARGIDFIVDIAADVPMVLADARGLHTILQNLLQNAVTFSPDGKPIQVTVRAGRNSVLFEIQDHGEGVPTEDIPRLMRPFEQGENALVRRAQGAGLGLPIVSLLCRDMGGRLMLKSAPGEGLTARVRLLAAAQAAGPSSAMSW
jgi:signal transduction histidine kinase